MWVDHMTEINSALNTFNMFTFKDEAHLNLWVTFWEKHGDAFFSDLSKHGCTRLTFNRVWNKEGQFKGSSLFEYENPDAFKACQKIIEAWTKKPEWNQLKKAEAVIETTRNIIMQDFRAV
tara:strand:+ start:641 stop:1000 length:360 start_codon:yes stop_codon:yes gene_type:complete